VPLFRRIKLKRKGRFLAAALACWLWSGRVSAQDGEPELRFGRILVENNNIFDPTNPSENHAPFTWANKLHVVTRERFIRNDLLFREGDPYDEETVRESERLLRSRSIFRYVTLTPQVPVDGRVDVRVVTWDVWTTSIEASYGLAGGKTTYDLGVLENNFLGRGISVGAFVRQDIDRIIRGGSVFDPKLFGTRWEGLAGYGRDEKGTEWEAQLNRPYFSNRVPFSIETRVHVKQDEDRLFDNGEEVAHFRHDSADFRGEYSQSLSTSATAFHRVSVAYEVSDDEYRDFVAAVPLEAPENKKIRAGLLGTEIGVHRFLKERGVFTFDRDEDLDLGFTGRAEAGPSLESWGATRDSLIGRLFLDQGWAIFRRQLLFARASVTGRLEDGVVQNSVLRLRGQYITLDWCPRNALIFRSELDLGHNLDVDRQFLLGGENGLRGYSVRQFSGDKKILFQLENRTFWLADVLNLINVGWAAFVDSGGVWKPGEQINFTGFHSDIGAGIRFAFTRSVDPSIIRMDLAYALDDNNRRSRLVVNIGGDFQFGEREVRKFDQ
jgi:hypothetical protein